MFRYLSDMAMEPPHPARIPNDGNRTTVYAKKIPADSSFAIYIKGPLFTLLSSTVSQCADVMNHIPSAPTHVIFLIRTAEEIGGLHTKVRWSVHILGIGGELTSCFT